MDFKIGARELVEAEDETATIVLYALRDRDRTADDLYANLMREKYYISMFITGDNSTGLINWSVDEDASPQPVA